MPSLRVVTDIDQILSQSSLLWAEQTQLPQFCLIREMLQAHHHFRFHLLNLLQQLHIFVVLRSSKEDTALQMYLTRAEQKSRTISTALLVMLFVAHPRTPLTFLATRAKYSSFFHSGAVQSIYQPAVRCLPNQNLAESYHQISRCGCLLCVKCSTDRSNILAYFTHKNVWIVHENAKRLVAIQWIIFYLLKFTPYCLLKILTSGVKQAIWFQSNAVIKTTAGGHLEHNGTASLIVTEM